MPLLGTKGAASAFGFGFTSLQGGKYWFLTAAASNGIWPNSVAKDASGNIFISGLTNNDTQSYVIKLSPAGEVAWSLVFTDPSNAPSNPQVFVDNGGNVFHSAGYNSGTKWFSAIAKIVNSTGAITFTRYVTDSSFSYRAAGLHTTSGGSIYTAGTYRPGSGSDNAAIFAVNSSATSAVANSRWGSGSQRAIQIKRGGTNYYTLFGSDTVIYVRKGNSSLTRQWEAGMRGMSGTNTASASGAPYGLAGLDVDASENVYVCATRYASDNQRFTCFAINTSGTRLWGKSDFDGFGRGRNCSFGDSKVYAIGDTGASATNGLLVRFTASNGNIDYARSLSVSSNTVEGRAIQAMNATDMVGAFRVSSGPTMLIGYLPIDGTLTGTYAVGGLSVTYGTWAAGSDIGDDETVSLGTFSATPATGAGMSSASLTVTTTKKGI